MKVLVRSIAMFAVLVGLAVPSSASADNTVYIDGIAYEDRGIVRLGDVDTTFEQEVGAAVDLLLGQLAGTTCVPKRTYTTISSPWAHVYYGTFDSLYLWEDLAEAGVEGCPKNIVKITAQLNDVALDGSSPPATGDPASASGAGKAGVVAELIQRYSNLALATGLSYHELTMTVHASQTDGRTTTPWCAARSWVYKATVAGPIFVGSSPPAAKCSA